VTYLDPDVISDEGAVAEAILAAVADQIPGWEPSEGHIETALAEAQAIVTATVAALLKDEARDAYSGFAQNILGIARQAEGVAGAVSDWTMVDAGGYLIPDGTQLIMDSPTGEKVGFATVGDVIVPPGDSSVLGVPVVALEAGPQANGLIGAAVAIDPVVGVASAALASVSAGGADAETIEDFVARAADRARRLRAVPITVDDFAALALDHESVARCMAVNLLDPDDPPGSGDEPEAGGHVTVFPIDVAGQPIAGADIDEVEALLTGDERPLNVMVHVAEPTYTEVDVAISVRLEPGADPDAMATTVEDAVRAHLSPATWAIDATEPGRWRAPQTTAERTIRHFDIAHVADSVPGVAGVTACTVNGGTAVPLLGWAPLPDPGSITATVVS